MNGEIKVSFYEIIPRLKKIITYAHQFDGFLVSQEWTTLGPLLVETLETMKKEEKAEQWTAFQNTLLDISSSGQDLSHLGALIEACLLPMMEAYASKHCREALESTDGRYYLQPSSVGAYSIRDNIRGVWLHSEIDPITEADQLAESIYHPDYQEFVLLGCGLGYLAYSLWKLSNGILHITVLEDEPDMLDYAMEYGVLSRIPESNLSVVSGSDINETLAYYVDYPAEKCGGTVGKYAYYWYLKGYEDVDESIKKVWEGMNLRDYVSRRNTGILEQNCWSNLLRVRNMASELELENKSKAWIAIAGGPSLDENLKWIRENRGQMTVVAATTSLRKLVAADVIPDVLVVMEAHSPVYRYIEGFEDMKVPMVLAPSAYWKYATNYQGEKYIAPIVSNSVMAIRLQREGIAPWHSGPSVASLAAEVATQKGAKRVFLVGYDFGFPGGQTHASGTDYCTKLDTKNKVRGMELFEVPAVNEGTVLSSPEMCMFREAIEEQISAHKEVEWINLSTCGAHISGTIEGEPLLRK